ncbi:MAG: ABC transporter ATP-binding protein [Planctomycetota bacterium]
MNGAGKTTLLRCFASVIRPSEGDVFWFEGAANNRRAARGMIGMVTHDPPLYPQLTLRENLVFAARMYRVGEPAVRADQLLQRVGLAHRADHRPTQVSRGMRQRVAVARALVHAPNILLLDEPFSGLDAEGIHWLTETLNDLRSRDRTICFASHDTARVHCLADRVFELDSGQLHRRNFDRASEGHGHIIRARAA